MIGRRGGYSALALLVALAGCVDGSPVEAQVGEPPVALAAATAEGDSIQLLANGTFKVKLAGAETGLKLGGQKVTGWIVGTWRRQGGQICARPNYFAVVRDPNGRPFPLQCGAREANGRVTDESSVFLWDRKPRVWQVARR